MIYGQVESFMELNKMICISSQKTTIVNCDSGKVEDCIVDYDEQERIAICDRLQNEQIEITGQFGGDLPLVSGKGEKVVILKRYNSI